MGLLFAMHLAGGCIAMYSLKHSFVPGYIHKVQFCSPMMTIIEGF